MKPLQTRKGASSFLQRFQGKKTTISKQGLIHLFEQHQKKMVNISNDISPSSAKKNYFDVSSKEILSQRSKQIRLANDLRQQKAQKKDLVSRLSHRTEVLKKQPMHMKEDFVLGQLGTRFSSSSHYKLTSNQKNNELQPKKFHLNYNSEKTQKKMPLNKNMDENALEHLQFLNKLQETLAGLRSKK